MRSWRDAGRRTPAGEGGQFDDEEDGSEVFEGRVRAVVGRTPAVRPNAEIERPKMGFGDVGGMESLKEEIA